MSDGDRDFCVLLRGGAAVPALRHAIGHARPDRRPRYAALLERLTGEEDSPLQP
ncbi:MAG TPA: hypothetical protein VN520_26230 [Streptomyces sp.]|uniref:hypothetical protein n=1 Tax=Streptomyces sp. TaxID=1931 RepID=UPI002C12761F|nr:hypothetical protein [Streptomyces sp.]HWU09830.1 hypothetical protein [Streptomyces sp.]